MTYQYNPPIGEVLEHHGILGMHWGIRRFQNEDGSLTRKGAERYGAEQGNEEKSTSNRTKHGLTEGQKKAIKIGAVAVATALVAVGTYSLYKSGKFDDLIEKGKNAASRIFDKNGADQSIQTPEWINKINPGFNESRDPGFKMNCGNCALAFELQSRGISASAKSNGFGLTKEQLMSNLKNVDSHTILDLDKLNVPPLEWSEQGTRQRGEKVQRRIAQSIAEAYKSSDTARGTLFVPGPLGSHYVSWMKSGSNVKFFNSQDPARDLVSSCFGMYAGEQGDPTFSLTAIRLDNLDFDTDKLKDLVNL